jgi:hypothetical protein
VGEPIVVELVFPNAPANSVAHVLWHVDSGAGVFSINETKLAIWPKSGLKTHSLGIRCSGFLAIQDSDREIVVPGSFGEWQAETQILGIEDEPSVDPQPPAPSGDSPFSQPGLRVLVVYESKDLPKLSKDQQSILFDRDVREFLGKNCVQSDGQPEYRIIDQNVPVYGELKIWKDALARKRDGLPWVLVGNGKNGFEGSLPATKKQFFDLVSQYAQAK